MLRDDAMNLELYIHIPFCLRKCGYCDFLSAPADEETREAYVQALCAEIAAAGADLPEKIPADAEVSSVYIGGGTPSILTGEQLFRIMTAVKKRFRLSEYAEVTCEVNPGAVDIGKLSRLRFAGVNRISIGLQSADDGFLRLLGRIHTAADFEESFRLVREAGFRNVSVDLIHSLPGQTAADWERSLRFVAEKEPEHISAYSLIIEEGTPFYERFGDIAGEERVGTVGAEYDRVTGGASGPDAPNGEETLRLPDEEEDRVMEHMTGEILAEYGYEQYEISNYAKPGFACRHNLGYWSDVPYIGFGLGASSYLGGVRWANPRDLNAYLEAASAGDGAFIPEKTDVQVLTEAEREEEFFFLGLRRTDGVEAADFAERFGHGWDRYLPSMERLERDGFLERTAGGFRLTRAGQDVSNTVFAEILF